jgi:hypothetical protein
MSIGLLIVLLFLLHEAATGLGLSEAIVFGIPSDIGQGATARLLVEGGGGAGARVFNEVTQTLISTGHIIYS